MAPRFDAAIVALEQAIRNSTAFRSWLRSRRWCGDAIGMRTELRVKDRAILLQRPTEVLLLFLATAKEDGGSLLLNVLLSLATARFEGDAFELGAGAHALYVTESERRETFARFLVDGFQRGATLRTSSGDTLRFHGQPFGTFRSMLPTAVGDTSNLLLQISTRQREVIFKSYKLLDPRNREPEILERLSGKDFRHIPRYLGELSLGRGTDRIVLGVATERVDAVDLFTWLTGGWRVELGGTGAVAVPVFERASIELGVALGEATAALHEALLDRHPGPFQSETFESRDAQTSYRAATTNLGDALRRLGRLARGGESGMAELATEARRRLLEGRHGIEKTLRGIEDNVGTEKCVTHADLHLGQVLWRTTDGQLFFIDFEGEPERRPGQRSGKLPPLRDVATMNRSFQYVTHYAWRNFIGDPAAAVKLLERDELPASERSVAERLLTWEAAAMDAFSRKYLRQSELYHGRTLEESLPAIRGWMMEKALYELRYEVMHRPANLAIPLEGILRLATSIEGLGR